MAPHSIARIEFNAVDLALDTAVRFANEAIQRSFFDRLMRVAQVEAKKIRLLRARLHVVGADYGNFAPISAYGSLRRVPDTIWIADWPSFQ